MSGTGTHTSERGDDLRSQGLVGSQDHDLRPDAAKFGEPSYRLDTEGISGIDDLLRRAQHLEGLTDVAVPAKERSVGGEEHLGGRDFGG